LDASLPNRYLPPPRGEEEDEEDEELGGDGALFEVNLGRALDEEEEEEAAESGHAEAAERAAGAGGRGGGGRRRREVTYSFFLDSVWGRITTPEQRAAFRPELVFTGAFYCGLRTLQC